MAIEEPFVFSIRWNPILLFGWFCEFSMNYIHINLGVFRLFVSLYSSSTELYLV